MRTIKLRTEILQAFLKVIFLLSLLSSVLGYYVVKKYVVGKAQDQMRRDLATVRLMCQKQFEGMGLVFSLVSPETDLERFKKNVGLDYLYLVSGADIRNSGSEAVQDAMRTGKAVKSHRLLSKTELEKMGEDIFRRAEIEIRSTPKARPTNLKVLENALSLEYAQPILDGSGNVRAVLYGGKILNRNFKFIDEISSIVFEKQVYDSKPVGTVTIFLDDVRIATNVVDNAGQRAIGTRVSDTVYERVVKKGERWIDRAFVVTDWYLTAYEPIRDLRGRIIGILYVGILEKPFTDLEKNLLLVFSLIILSAAGLAMILSLILSSTISKPVTEMRDATAKISGGNLNYRLGNRIPVMELNELADSFNLMAERLEERERRLKIANEKLEALNKSYLDMIGFVSHELKGILGSIVMNIYSVKEGYLGALNEKQQKAVNAVANSLDHFENMVRNYLDLSRIEKGELEVVKSEFDLVSHIIRPAVEHFEKQRQAKNMRIETFLPSEVHLLADRNLIAIVCNNLLGNALKYGTQGGVVRIDLKEYPDGAEVRFYNDGSPIPEDQKPFLFKRFSRLPGSEKIKGTGLGLFIVKEIVEKHGGKVWVESQAGGNTFIFTLKR
ncbi:MAG TPA: cache domain-containing protein [Candidatus Omnitrophota bacterium]|nr:cache domain-containing protein [Candidatus Omnitrophota bacterium]